jgi:hypothetical protein
VDADAEALLEQARNELYHARVLVRGLRNRTTTDAIALHDSELRIERLIAQIEARHRNGSYAEEAQGHEHEARATTQ